MNSHLARLFKFLFSAIAILAIADITCVGMRSALKPAPDTLNGVTKAHLQLGYYDFMSQRSEIYNAEMNVVEPDVTLMVVTKPEDERFLLKGKFTRVSTAEGKRVISYSPIYYNAAEQQPMVDGMLDFLLHQKIWRVSLRIDGELVAVGQSGSIFVYPNQ